MEKNEISYLKKKYLMKKKISRREALRLFALTSASFLAACRATGNSSTPTDSIAKNNQPQASRPLETVTPPPTQPANLTMTQAPIKVHAENQTGLTPQPGPSQSTLTNSKILLAYFSRAGENYYYGDRTHLEVGNTEILAGMISKLIRCDVHRIEAVDPYSDGYKATVERNVREQEADARPAIANPLDSIEPYGIVLLGSPIWNVRAPMIMTTFVEGFDFTGKTVIPFTTHAMSGLGTTARDYDTSCPGATIGEGLAVRGEQVRDAGAAVEAWLRHINLLKE
jgi:flavodoxin